MRQITLDAFLEQINQWTHHNDQRQGEWCFSVLIMFRPDLAEKCRDTSVDPFYSDSRISLFIYWVKLMWNADLDTVSLVPVSLSDLKMRYPL